MARSKESNRRPWLPWFPADWRADHVVRRLSLADKGLYREALDACWLARGEGLTPDVADLATEIGWTLRDGSIEDFRVAWGRISHLFESREDGKIYSPRMAAEWSSLDSTLDQRVSAGRRRSSSATRDAKGRFQPAQSSGSPADSPADSPASLVFLPSETSSGESSSSSSSSSSSPSSSPETTTRGDALAASAASSECGSALFILISHPWRFGQIKARNIVERGITVEDLEAWEKFALERGRPAAMKMIQDVRHPDQIPVDPAAGAGRRPDRRAAPPEGPSGW